MSSDVITLDGLRDKGWVGWLAGFGVAVGGGWLLYRWWKSHKGTAQAAGANYVDPSTHKNWKLAQSTTAVVDQLGKEGRIGGKQWEFLPANMQEVFKGSFSTEMSWTGDSRPIIWERKAGNGMVWEYYIGKSSEGPWVRMYPVTG